MRVFRTEKILSEDGALHLEALPFRKGEAVEVIVQSRTDKDHKTAPPSLKGKVLRYDHPTEPVAQDDWDALR